MELFFHRSLPTGPWAYRNFQPLPAIMSSPHPGYGQVPFESGPFPDWAKLQDHRRRSLVVTDGQDLAGFQKLGGLAGQTEKVTTEQGLLAGETVKSPGGYHTFHISDETPTKF